MENETNFTFSLFDIVVDENDGWLISLFHISTDERSGALLQIGKSPWAGILFDAFWFGLF